MGGPCSWNGKAGKLHELLFASTANTLDTQLNELTRGFARAQEQRVCFSLDFW